MPEITKLDLLRADGGPLVHKYYRQAGSPEGLIVALPGNHYGVDGPLLYYPNEFLRSSGWDTLSTTYGYQSRGLDFSPELVPEVFQECQSALQTTIAQREYGKIALLGKSLGALIVAQLCTSLPELASAFPVFLTPPINAPIFDQLISQLSRPVYIALGTSDRFYSGEVVEDLKVRPELRVTLIQGADHSLYIERDLEATMEGLKRVVGEVVEFIQSR